VETSADGNVYPAFLANDGNRTENVMAGSCAVTQRQQNAWWVVDLGIPVTVKFVLLLTASGKDVPYNLVDAYIRNLQTFRAKCSNTLLHIICLAAVVVFVFIYCVCKDSS